MSVPQLLRVGIDFDLICPWCFIGKRQFERARAMFKQQFPAVAVATTWHPVQLLPGLPEQGVPFKEFYEQRLGSAQAVRQRQQQVLMAAKRVELELDFAAIRRMPNTRQAHALLRAVADMGEPERYEALLELLFSAHFQRGEDIGDAATLRALAMAAGIHAGTVAVSAAAVADTAAAAPAIVGVPYFVFNDGISLSGAQDADVLCAAMKLAAESPNAARKRGSEPKLHELTA